MKVLPGDWCCMVIMIYNYFMPDHKGNIRLVFCSPSCNLSCRASFCVVRYRFTSCSAVTLFTSSGMCDSFMKWHKAVELIKQNMLIQILCRHMVHNQERQQQHNLHTYRLVHHYLILCKCKHTWMFQWNSLRTIMSPSKLSNKNLTFLTILNFWTNKPRCKD